MNAQPRKRRSAVLIVSYPDGFCEIFAEPHVDARIVRVPIAHCRENEDVAEQVAEMTTPRRYRDLWRRDYLRAVGSTLPLKAESLAAAIATLDISHSITKLPSLLRRRSA